MTEHYQIHSQLNRASFKRDSFFHKYFNKFSGAWSVSCNDDFTQADKLLELKEIAKERGIL